MLLCVQKRLARRTSRSCICFHRGIREGRRAGRSVGLFRCARGGRPTPGQGVVVSLSRGAGFSQWFQNRNMVTVVRVKHINSMTAHLTRATMRRKTGPTFLAVARTAPVFFLVAIRSVSRRIHHRPVPTPNPGTCPDPAGRAPISTSSNPAFAYEESAQTSGGAAAAAHSWADAADGEDARHAVVSGCVSAAAADGTRVASGGGGPGAQARTRRPVKLELRSPPITPDCTPDGFAELRLGKQTMVEVRRQR